MSAPRLAGRAGLVTGASRGIGAAITLRLAADGATVMACARGREELDQLVTRADGLSGVIVPRVADVTDEVVVQGLVDELERTFDGPSFVVNNAGLWATQRLDDMTAESWAAIEDVNIRAVLWGCKYGVAAMLRRGQGGSIVNIGSTLSLSGVADGVGYTMTKHAVLGLTRAIAVDAEYVKAGVRANCVCPGDIETEMVRSYWAAAPDPAAAQAEMEKVYPGERLGRPEEIAALVAFLASDESTLMNGGTFVGDGGLMARVY